MTFTIHQGPNPYRVCDCGKPVRQVDAQLAESIERILTLWEDQSLTPSLMMIPEAASAFHELRTAWRS